MSGDAAAFFSQLTVAFGRLEKAITRAIVTAQGDPEEHPGITLRSTRAALDQMDLEYRACYQALKTFERTTDAKPGV